MKEIKTKNDNCKKMQTTKEKERNIDNIYKEISYKTISDLIIVVADMELNYDENSIEDLLQYLEQNKEKTILV